MFINVVLGVIMKVTVVNAGIGYPLPAAVPVATPSDIAAYIRTTLGVPVYNPEKENFLASKLPQSVEKQLGELGFIKSFAESSGKTVIMWSASAWALEIARILFGLAPSQHFGVSSEEDLYTDPIFSRAIEAVPAYCGD